MKKYIKPQIDFSPLQNPPTLLQTSFPTPSKHETGDPMTGRSKEGPDGIDPLDNPSETPLLWSESPHNPSVN